LSHTPSQPCRTNARDKLAAVLAGLADGTARSTIARKVGVGYATVARIAETTTHPLGCNKEGV
jgi:hypothetical protein